MIYKWNNEESMIKLKEEETERETYEENNGNETIKEYYEMKQWYATYEKYIIIIMKEVYNIKYERKYNEEKWRKSNIWRKYMKRCMK